MSFYGHDTGRIHAYAFDIQADGRLANQRIFTTYAGRTTASTDAVPVSAADGLTIDDEGRFYALTEAGIEVVAPNGNAIGIIPLWCITRRCQNLSFGGPDKKTLYIAGGGTLLRIPMLARGFGGRVK
jgi:gluconolactonase